MIVVSEQNPSHRLTVGTFDSWSVGLLERDWEVVLVEGGVQWGWALMFQKTHIISRMLSPYLLLADQDTSSQLFLPLCLCSAIRDTNTPKF